MLEYDLIIVGAGLYGSVLAYRAKERGLRVLVLEKRIHVGGNVRDEQREGINVHCYGPHIFHTKYDEVWHFAERFISFNHFRYMPLARYKECLYNLPFNMHTFYQLYGVQTPEEAKIRLEHERLEEGITEPHNLEEKAISLVGRTLYERLIKGYTEKQWGCKATELPSFIIERLPVRFTYDNNYFNDPYQGIPVEGYTLWVNKMLDGVEVRLGVDFLHDKWYWLSQCKRLVYSGSVDALYDYQLGELAYRSLRFEDTLYDMENVQGCAVINETDITVPYTRSIEHKHFNFGHQPCSIVTREYPQEWDRTKEAFYPVDNESNRNLYLRYKELNSRMNPQISLGGRLGDYRYYNMDEVIKKALEFELIKKIL